MAVGTTGLAPDPKTFYREVDEADDPSGKKGIFDRSNNRNPIADHTVIFVPYCTADTHLGTPMLNYAEDATLGMKN